jgi:anthranilate phosphoribosyltransferase
MGIYSADLVEKIAGVLRNLGAEAAMVVHSDDGLDELSVCEESTAAELRDGELIMRRISPGDVGLETGHIEDLLVDSPEESAEVIRAVLTGRQGTQRDMVLLNAGAAVYVGGRADSVEDGIQLAAETIDSGTAEQTLVRLAELSNLPAPQ